MSAKRILVVDDDPLVCESIRMILEADGHAVETALSGKAAMDLFQNKEFDLTFVDYQMPDLSGDDLAVRNIGGVGQAAWRRQSGHLQAIRFGGGPERDRQPLAEPACIKAYAGRWAFFSPGFPIPTSLATAPRLGSEE